MLFIKHRETTTFLLTGPKHVHMPYMPYTVQTFNILVHMQWSVWNLVTLKLCSFILSYFVSASLWMCVCVCLFVLVCVCVCVCTKKLVDPVWLVVGYPL